jgi:hypothetical protein
VSFVRFRTPLHPFNTYGFYYPTCSKTGSPVIAADATSVADLENEWIRQKKSLAVK